jgi:hypothetical protein
MAKGYTYHGPADFFQLEEGGTVYHPGDTVPISAELAEHMMRQGGHVFEGIDLPSTPGAGQSGAFETMPKPSK